jgi:FAD/FMN-containing dehydrogenase
MWDKRMRSFVVELAARLPITSQILNLVLRLFPKLAPVLLETAMSALVKDEYDEVSYKVFNIGNANLVPALSGEVGIALPKNDGDRRLHIAAVERIFEVAARLRDEQGIYQSAPIALRFVKASPAYMSMMYGQDTMMMELIELKGVKGAEELTFAYEDALHELGGRPHWGQLNRMTPAFVSSAYPRYDAWQRVRARFDPKGVFASPFTKRVGISP